MREILYVCIHVYRLLKHVCWLATSLKVNVAIILFIEFGAVDKITCGESVVM